MGFQKLIFLAVFLSEALRCPNPKKGFAQKCLQDLHFARPFRSFRPVSTQPYQSGRAKCKSYRHFRAKLKHVLRLGHLRASLSYTAKEIIYKSSSRECVIICLCCFSSCALVHQTAETVGSPNQTHTYTQIYLGILAQICRTHLLQEALM